MGYSEFPHANYSADDMSEFIALYKDLRDKYAGTLQQIEDTNRRLTNYENNMNSRISNIETVLVPRAVEQQLAVQMQPYRQEIQAINQNIVQIRQDISDLRVYTDSKLALLDTQLRQLVANEVNKLNSTVEHNYADLLERINDCNSRIHAVDTKYRLECERLQTEIDDFNQKVDTINERTYAEMIVRDTAVLSKAEDYTERRIKDVEREVKEINLELDQHSIRWLWNNACNFGGYNAFQWYMDVKPTAEEWSKRRFTCVDWYVRGRELWNWFRRKEFMFSPISGRFTSVQVIITELCNLLKHGDTAKVYDEAEITAEAYDENNITAFEYDWEGVVDV